MSARPDPNCEREWVTASDLLELSCPALPTDQGALSRFIERRGWRFDGDRARLVPGRGRGGGGWKYHISLLPPETQAALLAKSEVTAPSGQTGATANWDYFDRLSDRAKAKARDRLNVVNKVAELRSGGADATTAVQLIAKRAGISASTVWNWMRMIEGVDRADWLPSIAPRHAGRTVTAECDPRAWEYIKADYLRPEQPSFTACHRRLLDAANAQGWAPIPAQKTLKRRMDREVPRGARVLARDGRDIAGRAYPHQTRDRSVFEAMQAVNADGHKFDVFVRWEDGTIGRPTMVAIQDLHSSLILSHRLDRSENWSVVRLAFSDMIESFGIPEHVWLDNGRSFASKWLTGGMPNRYRFKVRDDEPVGLLTQLGIKVHWATPYHGQAKPIERAFRDLCEEVAKHPVCAGAYTGNRPDAKPDNYASKAVPIEKFRALVAQEISRHNLRSGRRTPTARGRSFAETFQASLDAGAMVTKAASESLRMFLMAAEGITARKPTGEIVLAGNRYWAEALVDAAGSRLVVRFDPQDLLAPLAVYSRDGRFICDAVCIEATGFDDIDAARDHARNKRTWLRMQRECLALERRMSIDEVAELLPTLDKVSEASDPHVIRMKTGAPKRGIDAEQASASFGRAVRAMAGDAGDVLAFPKKETGTGD